MGLFHCWAELVARGPFHLIKSFSFQILFSGMIFDMNSNPFEFKLLWGFLQGSVGSQTIKYPSGYLAKAWSSLGFEINRDFVSSLKMFGIGFENISKMETWV